jgi:hypothetical protein
VRNGVDQPEIGHRRSIRGAGRAARCALGGLGALRYSLRAAVGHEAARRERAPRGAPSLAPGASLAPRAALDRDGHRPLPVPLPPAPVARRAAVDTRATVIELTTLAVDATVGQGFVTDGALTRGLGWGPNLCRRDASC